MQCLLRSIILHQLCNAISYVPSGDYLMMTVNSKPIKVNNKVNLPSPWQSLVKFNQTFYRFHLLENGFYTIEYMDCGLVLTSSIISDDINLEPILITPSINQQFRIQNIVKDRFLIFPRRSLSPQKLMAFTDTSLKQVLYNKKDALNQYIKLQSINDERTTNPHSFKTYVTMIILLLIIISVLYRQLIPKSRTFN